MNGWVMPYRLDCGLTAYKWNREKVLLWWKKRHQAATPEPVKGKRSE